MKISAEKTFLEYFYHWESTKPDEVYMRQPFGDTFRDFTWKEAGQQMRKIAGYLKDQNLPPKSNIGLVSKNCAEWIITDLAILHAGHVSVPFYPTLIDDQIEQVVSHSECKYLFVGKLDNWSGMKKGIPEDVQCISFPTYNADPDHLQWNDLLEKHQPVTENYHPQLDGLMTIIYTSGTTGNPKGVMLNFKAFAEGVKASSHVAKLEVGPNIFFSYLPLCHIAERCIAECAGITTGGVTYFADTLDTFAKNLQNASPTHFLAVPRIWTKFQQTILSKIPQKRLDLLLKIPILNGIIRKKMKAALGLTDTICVLTGAAPMPTSLIQWFRKIDIYIQEAYGMTENLGAVCMMPRERIKDGSVGKLYPGIEVKLHPQTGEILTRSAWNMDGYFKEPEITARTIDSDGWIQTGDVGELDSENYLRITGRVKEMYKTAKGEYIAPAQIEMGFAENSMIEQVCVVGQSLPQPVALVILSTFCSDTPQEEVNQSLAETLNKLNPSLKSYERINKVIVLKEPWSVENNMMTPTFKLKRNIIEGKFEELTRAWYEIKEKVIWEK
jgi:long-chain acyl-CoA synthetase